MYNFYYNLCCLLYIHYIYIIYIIHIICPEFYKECFRKSVRNYLINFDSLNLEIFPVQTWRIGVEILGGDFIEISLILKGESPWKFGHGFKFQNRRNIDEFSTCIFLSFRRQIGVTSVLAVSIV